MKLQTKKVFMLATFAVFFLTMMASVDMIAAAGPGDETNVDANQFKGKMNAGETQAFKFRNRFRFQLKMNASSDVDIQCDVDAVGDQEFQLEVNTSAGQKLTVQVMAENSEVDLENGAQVQTRTRNRYQYQQKLMLNMSLNETQPTYAKMGVKTDDEDATWAYFDEEASEWVESASEYVDGVLTTETDHFSVWTVLSPEEDGIDAYPLIFGVMSIGIIGLIIRSKRRN